MQYKSSFFFNYFQFFLIDVVSASQSLNHLPNPAIHPAEAAILCTPMNHQSKSLGRQMTFCQTVAPNPSPVCSIS